MRNRGLTVVCVAACIVLGAPSAWGATIRVTTTDLAGSPHACSLTEAIHNANMDAAIYSGCQAGHGRDVIILQAGATYSVADARDQRQPAGIEVLGGSIVIEGKGATLVPSGATSSSRAFLVQSDAQLFLNDVTLRGFEIEGDLYGGGAILNYGGFVWLDRCTITENRAPVGGGLQNVSGTMYVVNTEITNNVATDGEGGGIANQATFADAELSMLWSVVRNNEAQTLNDPARGGGISSVADGDYRADLNLKSCEVANNVATRGFGGGIAQFARASSMAATVSASIESSQVVGNRADSLGGGVYSSGLPSLGSTAEVNFEDATISENSSSSAGGVDLLASTGRFTASTVADNEATRGLGGGIRVAKGVDFHPGRLEIMRSTVSGNSAKGGAVTSGSGGGILIVDSSAVIKASTISGNSALGRYGSGGSPKYDGPEAERAVEGIGGGIAVLSGGDVVHDTRLYMVNSTLADNVASSWGGAVGLYRRDGNAAVEAVFRNNLMAYNREGGGVSPGTCAAAFVDPYREDPHPKGEVATPVRFRSQGYNMADDSSCAFDAESDAVVQDARLSELGNHGGGMLVHMPLEGSPAIDGGDSRVRFDQRGYPRNIDGDNNGSCTCDNGAVEAFSKSLTLPPGPEPRGGTHYPDDL